MTESWRSSGTHAAIPDNQKVVLDKPKKEKVPRTDKEPPVPKEYKPLADTVKKYKIKLTFTEPILGSAPSDKEVYATYIAGKKEDLSPDDVQRETDTIIEDLEKRGKTIFRVDPKTNAKIFLAYMVKGFLKAAARVTTGKDITSFKSKIDTMVFVFPNQIPLTRDGQPVTEVTETLQRPLQAQTPQGPRVSLANSEIIDPGVQVEFVLHVLPLGVKDISQDVLKTWFDYGQYSGISQWRNAGYGRFTYELTEL